MSKTPLDPCTICNRTRKSNRYPTCCSDCPETGGARHSEKCDFFQNYEEHLQSSTNMANYMFFENLTGGYFRIKVALETVTQNSVNRK